MNIWCLGRNYADHATEMNAEVPTTPLIFLKSGNCITTKNELNLPAWSENIHYELEIALQIDSELKFAQMTLALDLTARDAQSEAKKNGTPWTLAKSFIDSAPIGQWLTIDPNENFESITFELLKNSVRVQFGETKHMLFKPDFVLNYLKTHYPVGPNDIILTGTPAGVGPLQKNDALTANLYSKNQLILTCHWNVK